MASRAKRKLATYRAEAAASPAISVRRSGRDDDRGGRQGDHDDQQRGRQQAPHAPRVEAQQIDLAGLLPLPQQQAGDEEAGDDVEDIDADESAVRVRQADVEEQHRQDGDRAQALDVGTEVRALLLVAVRFGVGRADPTRDGVGPRLYGSRDRRRDAERLSG